MSEYGLAKYEGGELKRVESLLEISKKLLSSSNEYELIVSELSIPIVVKGFKQSGSVEIKGKAAFLAASIGESIFIIPVIDWIEKYLQAGNSAVSVDLYLEATNTVGNVVLLSFFTELKYLGRNYSIEINWYYLNDDEDMKQTTEGLSEIIPLPFKIIPTATLYSTAIIDEKLIGVDDLFIPGTLDSPEINFKSNGYLTIIGKSIPNNTDFYWEAHEWIEEYNKNPADSTYLKIDLENINAISLKLINHIIIKSLTRSISNSDLKIEWYYDKDDNDLKEGIYTVRAFSNVPIKAVPK